MSLPHISVCLITFKRREMLLRLLRSLVRQRTNGEFSYSVMVVDNDVDGSGESATLGFDGCNGIKVEYRRGSNDSIPDARNRGIFETDGDYVAIIDDDEFAPSLWLLTMFRGLETFEADGVLGPVIPYFDAEPPAWLEKGRFCERPPERTGTVLRWDQTRTGNVLIKREIISARGISFDPAFRTGGSDREFFRCAMAVGCRFVFVAEAGVFETVPRNRWTVKYWLRRALVNGANAHRNSKNLGKRGGGIVMIAKALACCVLYLVALPVAALGGKWRLVRILESWSHHFSRLMAMIGVPLISRRGLD